jgi:hypothetical protein
MVCFGSISVHTLHKGDDVIIIIIIIRVFLSARKCCCNDPYYFSLYSEGTLQVPVNEAGAHPEGGGEVGAGAMAGCRPPKSKLRKQMF